MATLEPNIAEEIFTNPWFRGTSCSIAGTLLGVILAKLWDRIRRRPITKLEALGIPAWLSTPRQYINVLMRELEIVVLRCLCTNNKVSVFLTCRVDPFWFLERKYGGTPRRILKYYEELWQKNGQPVATSNIEVEMKRIMLLTTRQIKRLKAKAQKSKPIVDDKVDFQDIFRWFSTANTFPCYWGSVEAIKDFYKKDLARICMEDYVLFAEVFLVRFDFRNEIMTATNSTNLVRDALTIFEDLDMLIGNNCVFKTFEDLYSSRVKVGNLDAIAQKTKEIFRRWRLKRLERRSKKSQDVSD